MSSNHTKHALHAVKHTAESLAPLSHCKKKNPALAALFGFVFGALGVGLYLESVKDGLIAFAIMIALGVLIPGIGVIFSLVILAGYACIRVESSNKKLGYH